MKKLFGEKSWASDERVQLGLLFLFALTVFFAKLGMNGMANYDDCFYAEKAKQILQNHNWWDLTYNHHPALENPPLYMWLMALAFKCMGVTVFAAKAPSALMGVLTVLLLYHFGKSLFNNWIGFYGAFILTATYPFFKYARHAMVDVTLTFFGLVALYSLFLALRKDRRFFLFWGLGIGFGMLTKSVLGLFPMVITVIFLLFISNRRKLLDPFFWLGCLVAMVVGGSWYWVEYLHFGNNFLNTHFGWLIFQRGLVEKPITRWTRYSYFTDLLTYYWPWLPLALWGIWLGIKKGLRKNEDLFFLLIWPLTIFSVMSVMSSHALWYILPAFPGFALWAAYALDHVLSAQNKVKLGKILIGVGLVLTVVLNAQPYALDRDREKDTRIVAPYIKHFCGQGAKLIAMRESFYGLNNAMLFFSDHAAEPLYDNADGVEKEFQDKAVVLCVVHRGDMDDVQKTVKQWYPVKYGEDFVLLSNQKLDTSDVRSDLLN